MKFYIKEKARISNAVLWSTESHHRNAKYYFHASQFFKWQYLRIIESRFFFFSLQDRNILRNSMQSIWIVKSKSGEILTREKEKNNSGIFTSPSIIYCRSMLLETRDSCTLDCIWTVPPLHASLPVHQNSFIRSAEIGSFKCQKILCCFPLAWDFKV